MKSTRKPTQKDIAKIAGVSQPLVSLVLRDSDAPVADDVRQRILDASQSLGYPLIQIRNKKSRPRHSKLLAYIRPSLERPHNINHGIFDAYVHFYNQIQNLLVEKVYAAGYEMIVRPYTTPAELTHWLIEWGVEGVFWHSNDESLARWISTRYPTVQINNRHLRVEVDSVLTNQEQTILQAIYHLRENGHERIALLTQSRKDTVTKERIQTYMLYMTEHHLPVYEDVMLESDLDKVCEYLLQRPHNVPTALIAGDSLALYIQNKLNDGGMSLPKDLSMVGIDNVSVSAFSSPRLTTIDLQLEEVVTSALSIMAARIAHPSSAIKKVGVSPKLIIRDSVFRRENVASLK